MNKLFKTLTVTLLIAVLAFAFVGCGDNPNTPTPGTANSITLLLSGWTNTPTTASDPYRAWIKENYDLDITLNATTDFANAVKIGFSSAKKPDIISFPDFTSFQSIRNQGVLLTDWKPYLDQMPNFKRMIEAADQAFTKQVMTDAQGNLNAIWTPATPPTWSLKIREDWANEYRATTVALDEKGNVTTAANAYVPAGATVTEGGKWMPNTPEDLIYFARWIKLTKNSGDKLDYFGFTTAGGGNSLGTLETWMPLMWGRVPVAPYGFYVDKNGDVQFSTTDNTYEPFLNYLRQLVDEKLIDPNWFTQKFADDKRTTFGKIGIQWYPGSITSSTQIDANAGKEEADVIDTTDWWETYPVPVAKDAPCEYAGYMAGEGLAGNIITVSKQTAMNKALMDKICAFIDDCYAIYDEATDSYSRGVAYDALRWGVGIEESISYQEIEGTNLLYCNTTGDENTYRESNTGAWDWGAWISSSQDGVVQGNVPEITDITLKVAEHDLKTATYKRTPQIGEYIVLTNTSLVSTAELNEMVSDMVAFAYRYATRASDAGTVEAYVNRWKTTLKGSAMLEEVKKQYIALGLM
ncbi:MAG: hypothetical protein IJF71_06325 [Clostridia bacterium]|nr:hypothetical protein [Clostridia bacterium]